MSVVPEDPRYGLGNKESEEEYRRRQLAKAKRRQQRRTQRILMIGAFVLAAVLLVLVIIAIFRGIFGGHQAESLSEAQNYPPAPVSSTPTNQYPTAPDEMKSEWYLQLVNGNKPISQSYTMEDDSLAAITQVPNQYWFDARIVDELQQMITDCNANDGYSLEIRSGYRSADTQNQNYDYLVELYQGQGQSEVQAEILARQLEPPSGYSEHQIGLAVDFTNALIGSVSDSFAQTPEFQWLWDNAHNYGFILRYPSDKTAITGFQYQPYHWRYVGVDAATNIKQHQLNTGNLICLEEYLSEVQQEEQADTTSSSVVSSSTAQ